MFKDLVQRALFMLQVIQRIFYTVNRSWSGKITLTELRKSNFLQVRWFLPEEDVECTGPCVPAPVCCVVRELPGL